MMKGNIALLISVILVAGMLTLGTVSTVKAELVCSLATLQGAFEFSATWFTQGTGATAVTVASRPAAQVGIVAFNGVGGFSQPFATQSNNGVISSFTNLGGTYTVNPDCTGTVTTPFGETANFVIVAGGKEFFVVFTFSPFFPGIVLSGGATSRIGDQACSLASVTGAYGFKGAGFFQGIGGAAATAASVPGSGIAIVTADGAGNFSAKVTVSDNGIVSSVPITGTYTVNPDCSGSATLSTGDTGNFVIGVGGKKILGISTTSGSVVTVVGLKIQ